MDPALRDLHSRLGDLAGQPVSAHPQMLEDLHAEIIHALDAIARLGSPGRGSGSAESG